MLPFRRLRTDDDVAAGTPDGRILVRELRRCLRDASRAGACGVGVSRIRMPYWFVRAFLGRLGRPLASDELVRLRFRLDGVNVELLVRKNASDLDVVREVILERGYDLPYERFCRRILHIVDLGSNIGVAAAFFSARFPSADILCVEPVDENVEVLRLNAARARRPWRIEQAIAASRPGEHDFYVSKWWATATMLREIAERRAGLAHRLEGPLALPQRRMRAMTIEELLRKHAFRHVDLLKVDIEGAERDVLDGHAEWLEVVDAVVIEIHDKYVDGERVRSALRTQGLRPVASRGRCELFARCATNPGRGYV